MPPIATIMKLLQVVGPITAALPEFRKIYEDLTGAYKEKDQATLQRAYREHQQESSGGHVRLQEMLRRAEQEA